MASLKVAVRARPLNKRELDLNSKCILEMEGNKTTIYNTKLYGDVGSEGDKSREMKKEFFYDYSYWSVNPKDHHFIEQETIFDDLGRVVLKSAFEGYNACVFAYGQTSAGKTYTMMGNNDNVGLIPRICKGLFGYITKNSSNRISFRTEVSYMEIYNEHVRDLLRPQNLRKRPQQNLKVREHPKEGPYVEGLTKQHVSDNDSIEVLIEQGNRQRSTASTKMNEMSSRSHAIFTIKFTQAKFLENLPSETISKIHLVDLAGSERASASGATGDRLKEGSNINRSLVTLGIVISTLAENSLNEVEGSKRLAFRKKLFVPYRDSVLTFLLKDSLGGNSKTVMLAAVSPAECNYGETLSTLRYAQRAKNIINRPTVNEDPNVKLIRDLRAEIERLKSKLTESNITKLKDSDESNTNQKIHDKEAKVEKLTKDWTEKWKEAKMIMQESELALRRQGSCVLIDLELPHLVRLEEDPLKTEIKLYRLMHGKTNIGLEDAPVPQDIVLEGQDIEKQHCVVEYVKGRVTLDPLASACWINGVSLVQPTKLNQGDVIVLGQTNVFKFNFPTEAAKLREQRRSGLFGAESSESLLGYHMSPIRGSHGDISSRSDVSSPFTLDSGVEIDIGEGVDDLKNNITDLISKHKEAEVRRLEVERNYREEIEMKQNEIEAQKEQIQQIRSAHDKNSRKTREELHHVQEMIETKNEQDKNAINSELENLFGLRKTFNLEYPGLDEKEEKEKQDLQSFMEDEWDKVEHFEIKLAEIELSRRKTIDKVALDVQKQKELLDWEKDQELRDIEEQQENLLELQQQLKASHEKAENELNKVKPSLERTLNKEREELEHLEKKIQGLGGNKKKLEETLDVEMAEEEEDLNSDESQLKDQRTLTNLSNLSASMDSYQEEKGSPDNRFKQEERRLSNLDDEVQRLELLKSEKTKIVTESQLALLERMNSLELYRVKIQENEEKLCELETIFKQREEKHHEKIGLCLENMREENDSQMTGFQIEREKYLEMLWTEYEEIDKTVADSCLGLEIPETEQKKKWEEALSLKRKVVVDLVKNKFEHIGSLQDGLFLDCLSKRLRLEQDEERVLDQERKISDEIRGSMKDKELAITKLSAQKDKFHIERERERKLIKSRLKRMSKLKSYDDLQSEETIEFLREETKKLQETFEKVEEVESRLLSETREKEVLLLQLDEVRTRLLTSEDEREELETTLQDVMKEKENKEKLIEELKRIAEEEKKKYQENLTTEDYEIVERPLVNRLHIRYRVIGNHAAAELLKEALLASSVPEIVRMFPSTGPVHGRESNHGGWTFHSFQKEVAILRKREELPNGFIYCFMGRGIIEASPMTVWEAVRNPLSRYIYDNMLKKISIVEHVEDGLKVVYMLHETSQCFMTHSRDFCYVTKERIEGQKYVMASQSIDHPKAPPVNGIIRAQILSSGWIVEPLEIDGKTGSLVWYITKVHLGNTTLPWRLIDLLSKRQPLSIAYLRNYLAPM
ncbi:kinesin-like protein KIF16B [Exaiptasia diaphana]|uniref:Kinesin-like protein KIF16B n=1 Tax=Exaiptasia diaphana TaxID=2652724 RepID=A0A913XTA1_EXADI|nr:kinesin-like protein KIF16B [Exaiptasia diaphana]KXJ24780.1 Kinesin-like protein KIF16B [Exaiptasia diaphana]